jgi:putative copper export protein
MAATAAEMSESWKWLDLWQVMSHTEFGHLWCIRVLILLVLFVLTQLVRLNRLNLAVLILVLLSLVAISSLTGHAGSQETGSAWRVPLFWLHSVAAGIWTGGLAGLYSWLGARISHSEIKTRIGHLVVERFSHFAMASTGIIFFTGLIAALSGGVSIWHPWATSYGQLVLAKTFFFSLALAAAAINQFVHLRKAAQITDIHLSRAIRREILIEIALVMVVFGIAGYLTRADLPGF